MRRASSCRRRLRNSAGVVPSRWSLWHIQGMNRKYRSLVWMVDVPGNNRSEKASRTDPSPIGSSVDVSSNAFSSVAARSDARSSRSSQPKADAGA